MVSGALPYGAVASVKGLAGPSVVDAGPASQETYRAVPADGTYYLDGITFLAQG